jgi:hypothetical protein
MGARGLIATTCAVVATLSLLALLALQTMRWKHDDEQLVVIRNELRSPTYEYKIIAVASGGERTGDDAMKFTSVTPDEHELSKLGSLGWEVVSTYLEMETAFPNFGNAGYVTGLQPNVRPQRLVMILRRRIS